MKSLTKTFSILCLSLVISHQAFAAAPYPLSSVIRDVDVDESSYKYGGVGGDIWPMVWAADGSLRTAYGDGDVACPKKVSYGFVSISSLVPDVSKLGPVSCGPLGSGHGKIMALGAAGKYLYAFRTAQLADNNYHTVLRSDDYGKTWVKGFDTRDLYISNYVNIGMGNAGAPGGYLYFIFGYNGAIRLGRVNPANWNVRSAYQWFNGTSSSPSWGSSARPIFSDRAGTVQPTLQYVPALKKYLMVSAHSAPGEIGIFESDNMYGPWKTAMYTTSFLGMSNTKGAFYSINFPGKWQTNGGKTLWGTFSCHDVKDYGACGKYHDKLNLIKFNLTVK